MALTTVCRWWWQSLKIKSDTFQSKLRWKILIFLIYLISFFNLSFFKSSVHYVWEIFITFNFREVLFKLLALIFFLYVFLIMKYASEAWTEARNWINSWRDSNTSTYILAHTCLQQWVLKLTSTSVSTKQTPTLHPTRLRVHPKAALPGWEWRGNTRNWFQSRQRVPR